jgi:large subunit ribosomal protein L25
MNQLELNAKLREDMGKGASRRLRRAGKLPGVVYGAEKDATSITLEHDDVVHKLEQEAFYSSILTLKIGKSKDKVVLKDLQRHPYKPFILHLDLQRISESEKLTMRVPIHFINEDKCVGVKEGGGIISHVMTELEISCLPKDLPEYIEIDMVEVKLHDTIHLGELKLPEGVESSILLHGGDAAASVVSVLIPKAVEEEIEEEMEELVAEEGAVPAAEAGVEVGAEADAAADESGDQDK